MRALLTITFAVALTLVSGAARAQSWQPPADNQRCPSKWGPGDERGSGNHMTPDTVLRAARLMRTGEVFELGRVLSGSMPFFGARTYWHSHPGGQLLLIENGHALVQEQGKPVRDLAPGESIFTGPNVPGTAPRRRSR